MFKALSCFTVILVLFLASCTQTKLREDIAVVEDGSLAVQATGPIGPFCSASFLYEALADPEKVEEVNDKIEELLEEVKDDIDKELDLRAYLNALVDDIKELNDSLKDPELTPEEKQEKLEEMIEKVEEMLLILEPAPLTISSLLGKVESLGLHRGTERSLTAKLRKANRSLEKGDVAKAIKELEKFSRKVEKKRGKKIANS